MDKDHSITEIAICIILYYIRMFGSKRYNIYTAYEFISNFKWSSYQKVSSCNYNILSTNFHKLADITNKSVLFGQL